MPEVCQVVFEQGCKQGQRHCVEQGNRHHTGLYQPITWQALAQPLRVPAHGQRGHAQIEHQPSCKQQVQAVAVDQRGYKHKQRQHQNAAIQQPRPAVEFLYRGLQLRAVPQHRSQPSRPDRAHLANQAPGPGGRIQLKGKSSLGRPYLVQGAGPFGLAQRCQAAGIPAAQRHRMSGGEFDRQLAQGRAFGWGQDHPKWVFRQAGILGHDSRLAANRLQSLSWRFNLAALPDDLDARWAWFGLRKLVWPRQEGQHRAKANEQRQAVAGKKIQKRFVSAPVPLQPGLNL